MLDSIRTGSQQRLILLAVTGGLVMSAPMARASDIYYVSIFENLTNLQTSNASATSNGAFINLDLNTTVADPYTSASVSDPSSTSPQSLTLTSPTDYDYSASFASGSAMQTAFPFGTYTFTGQYGGGGSDTASLSYTANDFNSTAPYLLGSEYSELQGMNAAQSFTFSWNPFTAGATAQEGSYIFFTIFDETTDTQAYTAGFLTPSTTSVTVPGGTLLAGNVYDYEIDYSNRDGNSSVGSGSAEFPPELGFDVRTDGAFTTAAAAAVPEPRSYAALLGAGVLGLLILRRRRLVQS
jgi:hypothetical protein